MSRSDEHIISSVAALEALYGEPAAPSLIKVADRLTVSYRALVEASPFVVIASAGPEGLDCSPRGDAAGVVRIADDRTLLLPDRRGNNRIDTLRNIVADPRVALLFLIPGQGETLRINGRAVIDVEPGLLESFSVDGKAPRSVLRVAIDAVYFQCARAILRSHLWSSESRSAQRASLPTAGAMLLDCSADFDAATYDAALPARQKDTLY